MLPKGQKESESAQTVLVRTINPISSGYFAVSERDLSFFLSKWSDLPAKNCSTFEL
jgi:hypothetical protein